MELTEAGDDADAGSSYENFPAAAYPSLNLFIASSLGLGYLCLLLHGRPPKPLSTAIGAAHDALKGAKVLRDLPFRPLPASFLAASKALIKGYKASKRLNLVKGSPPFLPKKASAYLRVLNAIRYARSFLVGDGFVGLGFLISGYKLSNNVLKAVEDFTGFRFHSTLRHAVDALGLSIKATTVAAELEKIAAASKLRRKKYVRCRPVGRGSFSSSRCALRSKLDGKMTIAREPVTSITSPAGESPVCSRILIPQRAPAMNPSELLCLSIPLI